MTLPLVIVLTMLPAGVGGWLGYRLIDRDALSWFCRKLVAFSVLAFAVSFGVRQSWYWPFGLVTPVVVGFLVAVLADRGLKHFRLHSFNDSGPASWRAIGGSLGVVAGLAFAIGGWQFVLLADSLRTPDSLASESPEALAEMGDSEKLAIVGLAKVAHEGFIKHVPVAGQFTEEMLAVTTILKSPIGVRKEFAIHKGWDSIAELESFQAIVYDEELMDQLDAAAEGSLIALYRLQKHPMILDLYEEEALRAITDEIQATQIASELVEFQRQSDLSP